MYTFIQFDQTYIFCSNKKSSKFNFYNTYVCKKKSGEFLISILYLIAYIDTYLVVYFFFTKNGILDT